MFKKGKIHLKTLLGKKNYNFINICEIFVILLTITKNMCCYFKMHLIIYARKKPSLVNKDLALNIKKAKKKDPAASYLRRGKPNYC
ncbi:hypothetical protein KSW27_12130, partial [Holdemanella biformis]|nr:hypothetical protein [Holdemanella biformis]